MSIELWVPIRGDGRTETPYEPDIPSTVNFTTNDGIPYNFGIGPPPVPICSLFGIIVSDADAAIVTTYLKGKGLTPKTVDDLPVEEQYAVKMIRSCRDDWAGRLADFISTVDHNHVPIKPLLIHATHRDARALLIAQDMVDALSLPSDSLTSGVDTELFHAAVINYTYNVKVPYFDNEGYLQERLATPAEATTMLAADLSTGALSRP